MCDYNKQTQNEWKWAKLSEKSIGKGLHKVFKNVVNELNNSLTTLGESVLEVSNFIPEPRNLLEFTKLPAGVKTSLLNATLKEIKELSSIRPF